jgi:ankyrin repeat protein
MKTLKMIPLITFLAWITSASLCIPLASAESSMILASGSPASSAAAPFVSRMTVVHISKTLIANTGASAATVMSSNGGRGGGDPLALEFKATASVALKNLQSMKVEPFSCINIALLQDKINSAQILISDDALPIAKDGVTQDGAAENRPSQNLIILNRADYTKIGSAAVQQALALHEFLSLAGMESTGNYPISGPYLIAVGRETFSSANQAISSATKSIETQTPCSEPNPDAATLFSMIVDANTPAQAITSFLQTHVVAVDALNDQCETSLMVAVDQGRLDDFTALYSQYQPDTNALQPGGKSESIYSWILSEATPTFLAYLKAQAQKDNQPLDLAPFFEARKISGGTDLIVAADFNSGHPEMIPFLIRAGAHVNAVDSIGKTALIYAAQNNPNASVVQALVQAGANVSATDVGGNTALMYAAQNNPAANVVQALIQAGANVNMSNLEGWTALMAAAQYNSNANVTRALVQAGADVNANAAHSTQETALMVAARYNSNVNVTEALIQAGANVNATNNITTALINAAGYNSNANVTTALIQAGANVNAVGGNGITALIAAAQINSDVSVTQALIQAGANVNAATLSGGTALMVAVGWNSNISVMEALVQAGANINAADSDGETVLMVAAFPFAGGTAYREPAQEQIIQTLVQAGANVKTAALDGETALNIAQTHSAPQAILHLLGG